ncbi:uncharacterized protein LOC117508389 [Thalassophryne amazonica]|uniref:uncharacterized protein LOC117508389 n=1 Tax=Thalassophryne amazonica TaxID=390379 RepID=UPI00147267F4|nr:uncharacterized protein LOC117508389 [Thalassophryne amazonica]
MAEHMESPLSSQFVSEIILEDRLVDLWPDYPCLYVIDSADFKNQDKRFLAASEIAEKLNKTAQWVFSKIKALRNSYTKIKKLGPSGSSRKSLSKRATWMKERLQFLDPHIQTRTSMSNLNKNSTVSSEVTNDDNNDDEDDTESLQDNPSTPSTLDGTDQDVTPGRKSTKEPLKAKTKSSAKRQAEDEYHLIKELTQTLSDRKKKREENAHQKIDPFACYVSEALSQLDPKMKHLAVHHINTVIFQAQMGTLGQLQSQPQSQVHSLQYNQQSNWFPPDRLFSAPPEYNRWYQPNQQQHHNPASTIPNQTWCPPPQQFLNPGTDTNVRVFGNRKINCKTVQIPSVLWAKINGHNLITDRTKQP